MFQTIRLQGLLQCLLLLTPPCSRSYVRCSCCNPCRAVCQSLQWLAHVRWVSDGHGEGCQAMCTARTEQTKPRLAEQNQRH